MALLSNKGSSAFDDMRDFYIPMSIDELQLPRAPPQSSRELLSTNEDTNIDLKASWRSLFFFTTRKHATAIVYCVTTTVASGVLKPVAAIFFGKIFSILTQYGSGSLSAIETRHRISTWCAALTGTGAATWLIEGMFLSAWMVFGELQAKSVRQKMFSGLLEKEMGWYDLRKDGMGSLLIRIQTQIRELQLAVSQPLGFLLGDVIGALASLGTAFYFSWKLTLVIIAVIPVAAIALFLISMKLGPAIEAQKRELTQASKYANTAATEIDTVKAYNGQDQEVWQYYSTIKKAAAHYLTQATCNALQFGVIKLVMVGIFVQGFWYGIVLVRHGMDAGHILTTFYATINALVAIETVLPQWLVLVKGVSAGETLKSILLQMQRGRKITKMAGSIQPKYCHGDIEVNSVSFCYPSNPDQASLINSTFFFPAGETTFIVGKSGSGKSTLGNLLMKYYEPSSGEILIDGHPLATLELGWLRSNITLIQQQSVLFNETLLKNVAFGNRDHDNVPRESVLLACETADLEETLSELPDGVDTVVGSNIRPLSGGQQQRVSIARGRLRDAPILILDEGTSALDHASRKLVMEAIKKWRQGKTTIIITHDITQISADDYVYVLESGMVVQEGYRKKLVEQAHGTFASFLLSDSDSDSDDSNCAEELPHNIDLRRKSEPASPTSPISPTYPTFYQEPTSSLDLDATPNSGYLSKFFGIQGAESESPFDKAIAIQSNNRMSLGVGSLYVNDLRATNIWSSPMIPEEEKFPIFRPSFFSRKSSNAVAIEELAPDERRNSIPAQSQRLPRRQILHPIETAPENFGKPKSLELVSTKTKDNQPKDQSSKKPASLRMILGTVWPTLVLRERVILILGFVAAFLVAAATPAFSYVFAKLLNVFYITENQTTEARKWALSMLAIAVVDGLASYSTHYALERSGQAWVNSLRVEALKRILCQPKAWFTKEKNSPARLNECLDRNAEEMRNLIGRFAGIAFTVVWMISISIVWSFMISWKLTLIALASSPVFYVVTRGFHLISSEWETKCNKASERATNIFTETFSNIRVVRALTLEEYFKKKHIKATDETYRVGISRAIYTGLLYGLSDAVSLFIVALVFYAGTVITTNGSITLSDCFQVVNLLLFGISNAGALLTLIPQISSSRATATHVLYLANMPRRASHEVYGTQRLTSIFPIQLNSLSFTYPDRPHIRTLDKISLTFDAGSCTAIVGPSGSGKSTIASILLGIYPPDISPHRPTLPLTFNYFSILSCNIQNLRSQISIVSQNPTLFPATIAQNITYGLPEGSSFSNYQNIMAAAAEAGIHEYIMSLPSGYDTLIGEGGQGLSGGQAQRIAIARALIRRPKLLVLDEATSALDLESAEIIRDTIRRLKRQGGIAVVMITHNVEMMKIAERVVVLEGGKVVEEGGFGELSRNGGHFAKLIGRKVRKKRSSRTVFSRALSPYEGRTRESWIRQKSI